MLEKASFVLTSVLTILAIIDIGVGGEAIKEHSSLDRPSYLWRVDSSPPSYLFGTVHVPYTLVWDSVPDNAITAFDSANQAYFELDTSDTKTQEALQACQLLPRGQNISQV